MLYSGTAVLAQEMVAELAKQLAGEQEGPWGERGLCLLPRPSCSAPGESNSRGERPWGRQLAEITILFLRAGTKIWESLKEKEDRFYP